MKTCILRVVPFLVIFLVVGFFLQLHSSSKYSSEDKTRPVIGNVENFVTAYEQWKGMAKKSGADRNLVLPLGYSKALSFKFTNAHGITKIDLVNGSISVEVSGLSDKEAFDVWLVDNKSAPKDSVKPEPWDKMVRVGSLKHEGTTSRLYARLNREALKDFKIDLLAVAQDNKGPGEAGLLFGSPSLFQRLYYNEQHGQVAKLRFDTSNTSGIENQDKLTFPFDFLVPKPALAVGANTPKMEEMIALGEELFFEETFNGNGRTCGTCHPMENNFTIDPEFIATLPDDDPLFVAEFNPALAQLENKDLMRQFGLILENVDGLDNPTQKFVMRGVPHTLALTTSLERPDTDNLPGTLPGEMTGWSGDGAPGSGFLRDFATGAVTQHFTKTLNRKPGKDFRLPNPHELDAMEAFQLSLGRQDDPNLNALVLTSSDALTGKDIFVNGTNPTNDPTKPGGKCSACHLNGGANTNGTVTLTEPFGQNRNFNTGVEDIPIMEHPAKSVDPTIPRDGGFGTTPTNSIAVVAPTPPPCTDAPSPTCGFGNGRFNSTPLVEAADTGPFFHNNARETIEEAVAFFSGPEFNNPALRGIGGQISLSSTQVTQVATFLRIINTLENIRSAIQLQDIALATGIGNGKKSLSVALSETEDAIDVLNDKGLHPDAVQDLMDAAKHTEQAINTNKKQARDNLIELAIEEEITARAKMCTPGPNDEVLCPEN